MRSADRIRRRAGGPRLRAWLRSGSGSRCSCRFQRSGLRSPRPARRSGRPCPGRSRAWPKASVREKDGHLAIAKFPRRDDEFNAVVWESVSIALAARSGIDVPAARIEDVGGKQVLLLRRFDRSGAQRIPFLSAMSMLGAKDTQTRSYLEIVDALRQYGAAP